MSAVKRNLSKNTIVILDNMSYIKGFRYQLYCEAKALETNSCVVYLGTSADQCRDWNSAREDGWPQDLLEALMFRFEEPNGMNRWDSPLFIVTPEDELPVDSIWNYLALHKPIKPTPATSIKPQAPASYLSQLNEVTTKVVRELLDLHRDMPGSQVTVGSTKLTLPLALTAAEMNRMKRNFIQLNKSASISMDKIEPFFLEYVESNWNL